jgi:hypothetical protein
MLLERYPRIYVLANDGACPTWTMQAGQYHCRYLLSDQLPRFGHKYPAKGIEDNRVFLAKTSYEPAFSPGFAPR